jgi:uncharacterized protein YecT (DUF1311 family)
MTRRSAAGYPASRLFRASALPLASAFGLFVFAFAFALAPSLSTAAPHSYGERGLSPDYDLCLGPNPSNAEIGQCLEQEAEQQEAWLNAAYRRAMARLAPARRIALRDSERIWVRRRTRDCERIYREMAGGTGAGPGRLSCLASAAAARTKWIAAFH